jgi:hypothetical protein
MDFNSERNVCIRLYPPSLKWREYSILLERVGIFSIEPKSRSRKQTIITDGLNTKKAEEKAHSTLSPNENPYVKPKEKTITLKRRLWSFGIRCTKVNAPSD